MGLRRDNGERASLVQLGAYGVVIKRLVADERREVDVCYERLYADAVMTLARKKNKADQVSQSIYKHHDLGGQATARFADGLILSPPFAPVACRWTLMIVPSMSAYSRSGSPDKVSKILSKTPLSAHRRNASRPKASSRIHPASRATARPSGRSRKPLPKTGDCLRRCAQGPLPCQEEGERSVPTGRPSEPCESRLTSIFQP